MIKDAEDLCLNIFLLEEILLSPGIQQTLELKAYILHKANVDLFSAHFSLEPATPQDQ